jgi:hypothetical protein
LKANGYKAIKNICEKTEDAKNKSLCQQILDLCEEKFKTEKIIEFSQSYENSLQSTVENNSSNTTEETKLINSLLTFKHRKELVNDILYRLNYFGLNYSELRPDLIEMIANLMKMYSKSVNIQINGIACLHKLIKYKLDADINTTLIEKVVENILIAMESFSDEKELQENALTFLSNRRILETPFDRYKCLKLLMNFLDNFEDPVSAIANCIILTTEITIKEGSNLFSNPVYINKVLDLLRSSLESISNNGDETGIILFTLVLIKHITYSSQKSCEIFIEKEGIDLLSDMLNVSFGKFQKKY